jgi:hypothetical protein
MAQKYGLRSEQTVWIVQVGWDINFTQELKKQYPEFRDLKVQSFGQNISVFKVVTGQRGSPPVTVLRSEPSPELATGGGRPCIGVGSTGKRADAAGGGPAAMASPEPSRNHRMDTRSRLYWPGWERAELNRFFHFTTPW